ncbi:MAG TPA: prolyl oligopeptidase family serine peptidase [Anaerolineae bacterium]|nr:prolyl oligopeptidase family serine peptidase [Anaerolineae bacterium]
MTQDTPYHPTLREMVQLEAPTGVRISPGGKRVAIAIRTTHWRENRYETICHVHDLEAGTTRPIHRSGSTQQMEWLDDQTLALLLKQGETAQVWLYEGLTGDGWQVTDHKTGVEWFAPFAGGIVCRASNSERSEDKARKERFGTYAHMEKEESTSALYYVGLEELRAHQARLKRSSEDEAKDLVPPVIELSRLLGERLAIRQVIPSPTGDAVYFNTWTREDLVYLRETRAYCIRLDARAALVEHLRREAAKKKDGKEGADKGKSEAQPPEEDTSYLGQITRLQLPRAASLTDISPDGRRLAVLYQARDDKMFTRTDLWLVDTHAALAAPDPASFLAAMHNVSEAVDQELLETHWVERGQYAVCPESTRTALLRLVGDGTFLRLNLQGVFPVPIWNCFHVSEGGRIALVGVSAGSIPEVYLAEPRCDGAPYEMKRLTGFGRAVMGWEMGTLETIRWTSRDGTEIEGILYKPAGFDPTRQYPLVFVVHGGPMWFEPEVLVGIDERGYYPTVQFLEKGFLVLKPNYRGSIGRGQAFAELNVNNLGIGDLWDLESAIDHLAALGWVDRERVGCMGWSQGGYISAFAGLHSDAFKAVSVGAGVSDWYTYHISNDIPDFTADYLSGSPFRDRSLYVKTAPIANLADAHTPMLIQHGTEDRRVPFTNAMELYRGLKEMGVAVELFAFPGMAHPITKPRENHAIMHQNLAWFSHYLLGEKLEWA